MAGAEVLNFPYLDENQKPKYIDLYPKSLDKNTFIDLLTNN